MIASMIYAATEGSELIATALPKISQNSSNVLQMQVVFDEGWNAYTKSAIFYTSKNPRPYEVIMLYGICTVPYEVLTEEAKLYITIKGVSTTGQIKTTTPLVVKVLDGTPLTIVSDPTPSVYNQLLARYTELLNDVAVNDERLSQVLENAGDIDPDSETQDIRVGADGTEYPTAGDAVRGQAVVAPSLASFILGYSKDVVIDTSAETITFPDDTLIMGYNGKWYQLTDAAGNTSCSYAMGTTAVNVVYQISTGTIFAQAYSEKIDRRNQVLLCSIRKDGWSTKVSISCNYTMIKDGAIFNSLVLNDGARRSSFLAPLITGLVDRYAVIDTNAGTITFPDDTLIIDPCGGLGGTAITYQLSEAKGNTVCKYTDYTRSSAVKIFYNPETDALEAAQYNNYNASHIKLILLATMRVGERAVAINIPYVVDGFLNGVDYSKWVRDPNATTVKAVNHRGYNFDAPENTLAAFRLSKQNGFKYVECDVSFTKDNYAVLLHDDTIDRTSNGSGNITDLTFAEVRALDFGSWKSEEYAGEQIPKFEEFILLCKQLDLHPYIELKAGTETQIKSLVNVVKRYGMKDKVTWISFTYTFLLWIKTVDPKARLGYVTSTINSSTINTVTQTLKTEDNEVFIDCASGSVTSEGVELCVNADVPLEVWTVNSESGILALNPYISGVTSDNLIAGNLFYENNIGG